MITCHNANASASVQLSPANPSYILTNVATRGWFAQMRREGQRRAAGDGASLNVVAGCTDTIVVQ